MADTSFEVAPLRNPALVRGGSSSGSVSHGGPPLLGRTTDSAFVRFKVNSATLLEMGFEMDRVQRALFRTVKLGIPATDQLHAAANMLFDGEEGGDSEGDAAAAEAPAGAARRQSADDMSLGDAPPPAPLLRRTHTDPMDAARETARAKMTEAKARRQARDLYLTSSAAIRALADPVVLTEQPGAAERTVAHEPPATAATTIRNPLAAEVTPTTRASGETVGICEICLEEMLPDDGESGRTDEDNLRAVTLQNCGHAFCRECVGGWISSQVKDGNLQLKCPLANQGPPAGTPGAHRCRTAGPLPPVAMEVLVWSACRQLSSPYLGPVPERDVQVAQAAAAAEAVPAGGGMGQAPVSSAVAARVAAALTAMQLEGPTAERPELLTKYRRFRLQQALETASSIVWCPALGCGAPIVRGGLWTRLAPDNQQRLVCGACSAAACPCGRPYHGPANCCAAVLGTLAGAGAGTSCESMTDAALAKFAAKKHLQPCPGCHKPIEKIDACPHMQCPCGASWCWVCRGPFPCGLMHFGVSGNGSGEEVGSLWRVQRAIVLVRVVTAACLPVVLGLAFGLWAIGVSLAAVVALTCMFPMYLYDIRDRPSKCLDHFSDFCSHLVDCKESVCVPILALCAPMAMILAFVALALVGMLIYIAAVPATLIAVAYLGAELSLALVRLAKYTAYKCRRGSEACAPLSEPEEVVLACPLSQTSLNLNLDPIEYDERGARGAIASKQNLDAYYAGPLPAMAWRLGRAALAICVAAWVLPPTCAFACATIPLGPCLPLPNVWNPRGRPPLARVALVALVSSAVATAVIYMEFLRSDSEVLDAISGTAGFGWLADPKSCAVLLFAVLACGCGLWCARAPATTCSCCSPAWHLGYSLPVTVLRGRAEAKKSYCAFDVTPDFPVQLPAGIMAELCSHLCRGDCDCSD